jgi:sortase A
MSPVNRALHILSVALITAGIVVLADVGATLLWKEPLSTVYGSIKQGQAEDELHALEDRFPSRADLEAASEAHDPVRRARLLADLFEDAVTDGEGIGRIEIPSISLDAVVIQGTDTADLQKGPGHYPDTAFPGQGKTIGIAGHRTTYLAPFRNINEIEDGDELVLEMPYGTFTYQVEKHEIVDPSQVEIVDDVGYERLVLTACHPLYSAAQRIVGFARLTEISLFGAGERTWQDP